MLGRPDRIEAERFNELAHVEGVIHVCGVRNRRRAGVVFLQQTLPVALVVARNHPPTVHACAPLPEYEMISLHVVDHTAAFPPRCDPATETQTSSTPLPPL